jgi:hypothetical protein
MEETNRTLALSPQGKALLASCVERFELERF